MARLHMKEYIMKIGDKVFIDCIDGFGGTGTIIASREYDFSRFKVRMDDKKETEFWAHDFELSPMSEGDMITANYIREVGKLLDLVISRLLRRKIEHDASKLKSPEREMFEIHSPKLRGLTYGIDEYKKYLADMKPALDHHYACNSHHPEHYPDGIRGMSLLDLIEMVCDWKAATMRHADGNILHSVEINQERFGYSDESKSFILNTIRELGLIPPRGSAVNFVFLDEEIQNED